MDLIVDIGNSSAKVAVFNNDTLVMRRRLGNALTDSLAMIVEDYRIKACALSIVGKTQPEVEVALRHLVPHTLHVTGHTPTPLICDYATPETLGADRLAAAVGAATLMPGHDLLVIDAGTCITYEFVNAEGHYLGGNISPGLGIRLRSLHEQTALLPLVNSDENRQKIGTDTASAIRAGVLRGMELEVEGYIRTFKQEKPDGRVFVTGGNSHRFTENKEVIHHHTLVETGLHAILTYNLN